MAAILDPTVPINGPALAMLVPSELEPVTWRDTPPILGTPDPFDPLYRPVPRPLERYDSGAYYDSDYYGPPNRYSKYSSEAYGYPRPMSSYDDSYSGYYGRGPMDYSTRGYDYRGARSRFDYDYPNTTIVTRDGYVGGPEFNQRSDYVSNGFLNPTESARQRYDDGYSSPFSSRSRHYRPYRSYDAFRYR